MLNAFLKGLGQYSLTLKKAFARPENPAMFWKQLMRQCNIIGIRSLPIVLIVSFFLGIVTTLQVAYMLNDTIAPSYIIALVARDTEMLELVPTGISAVVAGVAGFSIAAELAYMRINEQIDVLDVMGINSAAYLILPKIIASLLCFPCIIILAVATSLASGALIAAWSGVLPVHEYVRGLLTDFKAYNMLVALVKSVCFGFVMATVSSYKGYYAKGSSMEISRTAVKAVSLNYVVIIFWDYIITDVMLNP